MTRVLKVLNPGEPTRSLLRFRPLAGSVQRIAVRSEVSSSVRDGGSRKPLSPTPGIQLTLRAEVTRVGADGEAHYRCAIEQVDLLVRDGTPVRVIEAVQAELATLPGLTGAGRVTADGRSTHFAFALPRELASSLRLPIEDMSAALNGLGTVLPAEAVGLGAQWEVPGGRGGAHSSVPMCFTLKTLAPNEVGVRMTLGETETPVGETMRARVRGKGGSLFALDRLWPTRMELEIETLTRLSAEDGGVVRGTDGLSTARMQLRELSFTRATEGVRRIAG
ncbi:MAG: hypothetical protein WBV82_18350 [Myxococcaceae bacterium]